MYPLCQMFARGDEVIGEIVLDVFAVNDCFRGKVFPRIKQREHCLGRQSLVVGRPEHFREIGRVCGGVVYNRSLVGSERLGVETAGVQCPQRRT